MHIGPIFRFHFIDCYHSELPEVTTSYNQRKTQECSEFLQREIGVVSLWSIQFKRHENFNADFLTLLFIFVWWYIQASGRFFANAAVSENQIINFTWPYISKRLYVFGINIKNLHKWINMEFYLQLVIIKVLGWQSSWGRGCWLLSTSLTRLM